MTWPLPWWVVTAPAVAIAAVSYLYVGLADTWAYISGAQLSGMLRASLVVSGPAACLAATWIAERFVNRRSPTAAPTARRASGQQGLRVLSVLVAVWCLALVVGGWTSTAIQFSTATGGSLDYLELFLPLPALCFLVITGFLIGVVIARWYAVLWSALWCLCWLGAIPLYYTTILPDPHTNTEFFLFPAPAASNHAPLDVMPVVVMAGWWLLALAALAGLLIAWFRWQSRRSRRALPTAIGGVVGACLLGVALQQTLPTPFASGRPVVAISCQQLHAVKVCVTD